MKTILATKKFHLLDADREFLEKLEKKLARFMPSKNPEYPFLEVVIRERYKKSIDHLEKSGYPVIDSPIYYEGTLDLILPGKRLVAKMLNKTVHEAVKGGFDRLFREIEKYKGFHFSGYSKYYSHATIRQR